MEKRRVWRAVVTRVVCGVALLVCGVTSAVAQPFETIGQRANGMGGAFVALADDSSAVWWNPAALAAGPFFDASLSWMGGGASSSPRVGGVGFAASLPMLGLGWARLYTPSRDRSAATATPTEGREDYRRGVSLETLRVSQFGVTFVHTLATGVHVGATLKYMQGTVVQAVQEQTSVTHLSSLAHDDGGAMDADLGVLARRGRVSVGLSVKNLLQPEFAARRLDRRVRLGAALQHEAKGPLPFTLTMDVDVIPATADDDARRVLAIGAERWTAGRRVAVRAGTRVDTKGEAHGAVTAGASVRVGAGTLVDAHVTAGGPADARGWGLGARVSF